ncbi:hypothetical protein F7R20_24305 [Pseudomonas brassicacearum subsp. brassicacearum]|nr:hypothetical protein F7R20_24305 [Pseudomonas brassicacearum subsp. brassicacearum]QEO77122.1 hypothetical protein ELZ14_06015 [Pseudomonas brassicacearum]
MFSVARTSAPNRVLLWERACSRRRQHIQHQCCLTYRFCERARSHRDDSHLQILESPHEDHTDPHAVA